ncbi:MAG: spore maturation protein [Bacilli bacterium]|nr:spore maturation protein [Bacilli bacterium]
MINYIFAFFFIIGIIYSLITGNFDIGNEMLNASHKGIELILSIIPIMCLWLGIMNIAKKSGLLDILAKKLTPILKIIFPEIPKNSPCFSYIGSNIIMNILGLGNAATPFGLKAIKEMQILNNKKDTASRSMITFLVMNTASVTIIPTTIISLRIMHQSINPEAIIPYIIITSSLSCLIGLILDRLFYLVKKT